MDESPQLAGRFLPSKVYARWKWTVRFGLFAMPLILFLAGGVVLYLAPTKYESKAVFEYRGSRTPAEAAALLKSRNVQVDVCDALQLQERWGCDKETNCQILDGITKTLVDQASGQIEVTVTHTEKESARDIAAELPKALDRYETKLSTNAINFRLRELRRATRDGEDEAEARYRNLAKLLSLVGEQSSNPGDKLHVTALQIEWEQQCRRVDDNKNRIAEMDLELASLGKFTTVHTDPFISQTPAGKKSEDSLGEVSLEALGYGLLFALLVPYLFELACPNHRRFITPVKKMSPLADDEWSGAAKDSELVPSPLNG